MTGRKEMTGNDRMPENNSWQNSRSDAWYEGLAADPDRLPFFFRYGGKDFSGFGDASLTPVDKSIRREGSRETVSFRFSLPDKILTEIKLTHYYSHGATEWTVYFSNPTDRNSAVLEQPETIMDFPGDRPVLKGIRGDHEGYYAPYERDLSDCRQASFLSDSGRATHVHFPYFYLGFGDKSALVSIGWAGTWHASFTGTGQGVRYRAGSVNGLRTFLKPGETIRTALFTVLFCDDREEFRAMDLWRSWFLTWNLPRADASREALRPFSTCCLAADTGRPNSDGSISEGFDTWRPSLEKMLAEDVKVDFRWLDAGWYAAPDGTSPQPYVPGHDWWDTVGAWVPDPVKWPDSTLRESVDFCHSHGIRSLLWFEPERITDPESMVRNHGYRPEWAIRRTDSSAITNNIGDEDCLAYTTERICRILRENRIDMYREDNNSDPAILWHELDRKEGSDRSGITECRFINNHYRMWDSIIACTTESGGCGFVDSCASGGGRNDLESLRRGVPILRSDADRTSTVLRLSMTASFCRWIPFCGAATREKLTELSPKGDSDPYIWRASYLPILNVESQFVQDPDQDFSMLRFGMTEWKRIAPFLLKNFYPLTRWHDREDRSGFTAFLYYDPEEDQGVLLAFRREECTGAQLLLDFSETGLRAQGSYLLTDEDTGESICFAGICSGENALTLTFAHPRMARLLWLTPLPLQ